jgi:glycosyltransferase involved in cell wall biosynthesis
MSHTRVVVICHSYPPVLGGSEIEAQRVSAALMARGYGVRVLCAGGPPMPEVRDWTDPEGVPVSILTRHSTGLWRDRVFALEVARYLWLHEHDYDLAYFLMQGLHVATGLPVVHALGKPVVMKISGDGIVSTMRKSRIGRMELEWLQQWRVPVMLLNEGMIQEAVAGGFSREQLTWMPNPVDIDQFRPSTGEERLAWREQHGIAAGAFVVVYTGRLSYEKGLLELLGGFAEAAQQCPEAMLLLIGDGPFRGEVEQRIQELGIPAHQIRLTGRVPLTEVPHWLRASDVFALTSPNEGFSCSLLEAMSVALPSVVSDIPANLQLVDPEVHGVTAGWNDIPGIADAILRLAHDAALRRQMGEASRQRIIDNYSTDRVLALYERLFDQALLMKQ